MFFICLSAGIGISRMNGNSFHLVIWVVLDTNYYLGLIQVVLTWILASSFSCQLE